MDKRMETGNFLTLAMSHNSFFFLENRIAFFSHYEGDANGLVIYIMWIEILLETNGKCVSKSRPTPTPTPTKWNGIINEK